MAEAKRHHYVPRVLLRRFSSDPEADNPPLWRLDKKSGRPSRTSVANEAVIGHYYRIDEPTPKLTSGSAEQDLARLEAEAVGGQKSAARPRGGTAALILGAASQVSAP